MQSASPPPTTYVHVLYYALRSMHITSLSVTTSTYNHHYLPYLLHNLTFLYILLYHLMSRYVIWSFYYLYYSLLLFICTVPVSNTLHGNTHCTLYKCVCDKLNLLRDITIAAVPRITLSVLCRRIIRGSLRGTVGILSHIWSCTTWPSVRVIFWGTSSFWITE